MKIIAFHAKKGNGKTTACDYIEKRLVELGYNVVRLNFKDELVNEFREYYKDLIVEWEKFYEKDIETLIKEKPEIIRQALQFHGQMRRIMQEDYWVDAYKQGLIDISQRDETDKNTVILTDDVRHENELSAVGGEKEVIKLIYTNAPKSNDKHPSETALDHVEFPRVLASANKEHLYLQLEEEVLSKFKEI